MRDKDQLRRVNLAHRLLALGVPLKSEPKDQDAGLLMSQIGSDFENSVFDLRDGRAACMVNMEITTTQRGFIIADIVLELLWTDCGLSLIEDPLKSGAPYNHYCFPGNDGLSFERSEVINHFVNVRTRISRGTTMKGLLLWVGSKPIPDAFVHGIRFPASVIVFDQYDNAYPSEVTLWADRSERVPHDKHKSRSRPSLFAGRVLVGQDELE